MSLQLAAHVAGNLGTNAGAGSDGVLLGSITPADPTKALLRSKAKAPLCYLDDGGTYTLRDTEIQEDTGDDVDALPATPAVDDATYFGHASNTFAEVDLNLTTQGAGTWTVTWEYWNGTAWTALSGVNDGTTGFTATTGWKQVTFTLPEDWATCTVDGVLAYWVRARVSAYTSVTTQPLLGQGWVVVSDANATWTDDLTDFTDAGAGDVALLPSYPVQGDAFFIGYGEKFCKLKITTSQERTGTATLTWKYWNGSAWSTLTVNDDSVGFSATAGTLLVHFEPPADWTANDGDDGPNGQSGFFICCEITALTSVTQQPLATQGWVLPLVTGASGIRVPESTTLTAASMSALTESGSTADSEFLVLNTTSGVHDKITWTKGESSDVDDTLSLAISAGDQIALVQIQEDGSTEFANANVALM